MKRLSPQLIWFISSVVLLGIVVSFLVMQFTKQDVPTEAPVSLPDTESATTSASTEVDTEPYMQGASGSRVSTAGLIEHPRAERLAPELSVLTTDPGHYDIFYNNDNKNIFILLYREPLTFSRSLAEEELKAALSVDEATLCDLGIQVRTNEFVNSQYAGFNLGLSFCPQSTSLENI